MPTYEYECKNCGHVFEAFQSMKDEPLSICPECGKDVRRRINGGTGVIFKGNGFYITDKPYGGQAASIGSKRDKDGEREKDGGEKTKPDASSAPSAPAASAPAGSTAPAAGANASS